MAVARARSRYRSINWPEFGGRRRRLKIRGASPSSSPCEIPRHSAGKSPGPSAPPSYVSVPIWSYRARARTHQLPLPPTVGQPEPPGGRRSSPYETVFYTAFFSSTGWPPWNGLRRVLKGIWRQIVQVRVGGWLTRPRRNATFFVQPMCIRKKTDYPCPSGIFV